MTSARLGGFLAVALGPLGWCVALGALVGGDPMLGIEVAGASVAMLWAGLLFRDLLRSRRLAAALSTDALEARLFDIPCRITPALGADAVVIGTLRPRIFVGQPLLATLAADELRAVVYHEDHHRRTWAPIRAAALEAWLRLLGRSRRVRDLIHDRLADLEALADADAIRRGSTPRALARALLKGDASFEPASFAYAADRRIGQLIDRAAGVHVEPTGRLPYEWLPVMLLTVATLGCHAGL
jgi:hypothetical protein